VTPELLSVFAESVKEKQAASLSGTAPEEATQDTKTHALRNVAIAGAGASPFLGMIGQEQLRHDPYLNKNVRGFGSMSELARHARPGDVVLTSKPTGSVWKSFIKPVTGSEFYHAQPVVGRRGGKGTSLSSGEFSASEWKRSNKKKILSATDPVDVAMHDEGYKDVLLLRPKKRMSPDELQKFVNENVSRSRAPYDRYKSVGTWLKETFVPKIGPFAGGKAPPVCKGNVCSTMPAMAYERAGRSVVPGKRPQDVFPTDFLRSPEFEAVGARLRSRYTISPAARRALPILTRAGLGAGMAAGVAATAEKPEVAALPVGALAGAAATGAIHKRVTGKELPTVLEAVHAGLSREKGWAPLLRTYATRRVPGVVMGAGLAYGGAHLLRDKLSK
jgi:hypothetical protein